MATPHPMYFGIEFGPGLCNDPFLVEHLEQRLYRPPTQRVIRYLNKLKEYNVTPVFFTKLLAQPLPKHAYELRRRNILQWIKQYFPKDSYPSFYEPQNKLHLRYKRPEYPIPVLYEDANNFHCLDEVERLCRTLSESTTGSRT